MLQGFGIKWPDWLAIDAGSASRAYEQVLHAKVGEHLPSNIIAAAKTYETAPVIGNFHILFDLPAGLITVLITALVFVGIKESKNVSNGLVILKLGIIALVIVAGAFL